MAGLSTLAARLSPERVRESILRSANRAGAAVVARTRMRLSGRVLNRRSGALLNSVTYNIQPSAGAVRILVEAGRGLKYGRIHEFGGTIRPRSPSGLLRFKIGQNWISARRVVMPKRPYLGPSVDEVFAQLGSIVAADMRATLRGM